MRVLVVSILAAVSACGGARSTSTTGPIAPAPPIPQPSKTEPAAEPASSEPAKPDEVASAPAPDAGGYVEGGIYGPEGPWAPVRGGTGTISGAPAKGFGQGNDPGLGGGRPINRTTGQVRVGTVTVKGALDVDSVRRTLRRYLPQVRYCFENHLRSNPTASGLLVHKLAIGADGKVTESSATGVHADVEACIASRGRTWLFPKPASGVVIVSQPYNMSPS